MSTMTKRNLHNIKCRFEEKTGADLNPAHHSRKRMTWKAVPVLAGLLLCYGLLAFAGSDNHTGKAQRKLAGMGFEQPVSDLSDFITKVKAGQGAIFTMINE